MIEYLKRNDAALIILAPVLLLISALVLMWNGGVTSLSGTPILRALAGGQETLGAVSWLHPLLATVMAGITFVFLNSVVQQLGLLSRLSNFPLLISSMMFTVMPAALNNVLTWLCVLFQVLVLMHCLRIVNGEHIRRSAFSASFLVGLSALIYPFFSVMMLPVLMVLLLSGTSLRMFMIGLLGFATPAYFFVVGLYLFSPETLRRAYQELEPMRFESIHYQHITTLSLVGLGFFSAFLIGSRMSQSINLRDRRRNQVILICLVSACLAVFFGNADYVIAVAFVPAAILISRLLRSFSERWVVEGVFLLVLIMIAINLAF